MRRSLHPRMGTKLDNRIEQAGEWFNQACVIALWLGAATLLFMYNAPVSQRHHSSPVATRELSDEQYLFAIADSHKGKELTEHDIRNIDRQFAMQTRQEDVDRLGPEAKKRYYASLRVDEDIFSVVDK